MPTAYDGRTVEEGKRLQAVWERRLAGEGLDCPETKPILFDVATKYVKDTITAEEAALRAEWIREHGPPPRTSLTAADLDAGNEKLGWHRKRKVKHHRRLGYNWENRGSGYFLDRGFDRQSSHRSRDRRPVTYPGREWNNDPSNVTDAIEIRPPHFVKRLTPAQRRAVKAALLPNQLRVFGLRFESDPVLTQEQVALQLGVKKAAICRCEERIRERARRVLEKGKPGQKCKPAAA